MLKLGKTAPSYCVYLEARCCHTEVSVLLKATSMDTLLEVSFASGQLTTACIVTCPMW